MKILIFGASGATGQQLVEQALEQGYLVSAVVRTPDKLKIMHPNLKVLEGDVVDANAVQNAVNDQDAVLCALGAASPFKFDQDVVDGVSNIIIAMEQSAVKRFIYLSFIGVGESRNDAGFIIKYIAPVLLKTEIQGHKLREKSIRESNLEWTIIQAPTLTNGIKRGAYRFGENIRAKSFTCTISRADLAAFMLKQITDNSFLRKAVRIM